MASSRPFRIFNNPNCFVEGWYWAIASHQLKRGQVKPVILQGRALALYRGNQNRVVAMDAYCPHMGAHLAEGKVEGNALRCLFHNWKFDADGTCTDAPCLDAPPHLCQKTFPAVERYGMVWIWTGNKPKYPLPVVPELAGQECHARLGRYFVRKCHPNVVMINAIDANHFNTVHNLPFKIAFDTGKFQDIAITFCNTTKGGDDSRLLKLIRPLYKNEVTYRMCYWYGSTGTVTIGPDAFHFHIMFALRMLVGGETEGQTILITTKRSGVHGAIFNQIALWLTAQVGNYFAKGDSQIFETIRFELKTPTRADQSILQYAQHVEQQKALAWRTWKHYV